MYNEDFLPFEQNNTNLTNFGFQLLANIAICNLSKHDMMQPDNVINLHYAVDNYCSMNQDQWEWEQ